MCWVGKNMPLIAKTDINVFKVVYIYCNYITSAYHQLFLWTLSNKYTTSLDVRKCYGRKAEITRGFHCYNPEVVHVEVNRIFAHIDTRLHKLDSFTILNEMRGNLAIMKCVIPAGATYYENDRGEIVTDRIIPKSYSLVKHERK